MNIANMDKVLHSMQSDSHPSDHQFVDDKQFPGTCQTCHWVAAETAASCCEHSLREHVKIAINDFNFPFIAITEIEV